MRVATISIAVGAAAHVHVEVTKAVAHPVVAPATRTRAAVPEGGSRSGSGEQRSDGRNLYDVLLAEDSSIKTDRWCVSIEDSNLSQRLVPNIGKVY
jgi:hypothetical protein